jgi:hypothetical protein
MASTALSRRVLKVVAYAPLCDLGDAPARRDGAGALTIPAGPSLVTTKPETLGSRA